MLTFDDSTPTDAPSPRDRPDAGASGRLRAGFSSAAPTVDGPGAGIGWV